MSEATFDEVLAQAMKLPLAEQAQLMERLAAAFHDRFVTHEPEPDSPLWSDEELAAMMQIEPLTDAEIIAAGLTGTWADLAISDSTEWVNEQKRRWRLHWRTFI